MKKITVALSDPSEPRNMRFIAIMTWRSLIVLAILLILALLAYGFQKFQATLNTLESANASSAVATKSKFSRTDFDATVKAYTARQLRYQVTEAAPPVVADPSK